MKSSDNRKTKENVQRIKTLKRVLFSNVQNVSNVRNNYGMSTDASRRLLYTNVLYTKRSVS